jgi:hypothetical protein
MSEDLRYSRPIAAAAALGEQAEDRHRFISKKVLLTGEACVLTSENGAEIARDALMLLIRVCPNIAVALPTECSALRLELEQLMLRLAPSLRLTYLEVQSAYEGYDAILSVGSAARPDLPWTVINSNGWLARVSSGASSLRPECDQPNPVGALGAACLGVGEVFKRLIKLRTERGELLDGLSFSLWTYSPSDDPRPQLPALLPLGALLVVGGGAIGNGTAHLLSRLPATGVAVVIDKQTYGEENWGTCLRLGLEDIGHEKAKVLASILAQRLEVRWHHMDIADMGAKLGKEVPYPKIVINGLDDIDARHKVQQLWPDLVIDGAIGSDFGCQVSCHPWGKDIACLLCLFRHERPQERAEAVASKATGLPESLCEDPEAVITEEHVRAAPEEKQAWLSQQIGKKVCSITPAAVAQMLSIEAQRSDFAPSVPFVACYSSCMIVTELVRYVMTGETLLEPRWQMNLLWGPERGTDYPEQRRHDCICVSRASNIDRVRSARS